MASPILVLLVIVIFTAAGVAVGLARKPKYSATARLAVLHLNFGAPGALNGFSTAAESLADAYARGIAADGVARPLAAQFHQSVKTINGDLAAVAVPQSPIFTITATTGSEATSIALANAAAQQLVSYFQSVNRSNPDRGTLYQELSKAESALATAQVSRQVITNGVKAHQRATHAVTIPAPAQAAVARADASVNTLQDRVNGIRNAYVQSTIGSSATQFIQPLATAFAATTDRLSKLALAVFIGLAVGIGLAVALALLRNAARTRALHR